jgi:hypothetical protein
MDGEESRTFGEGANLCTPETWSLSRFQNTKQPVLRFRALLADGTREVRFERATTG